MVSGGKYFVRVRKGHHCLNSICIESDREFDLLISSRRTREFLSYNDKSVESCTKLQNWAFPVRKIWKKLQQGHFLGRFLSFFIEKSFTYENKTTSDQEPRRTASSNETSRNLKKTRFIQALHRFKVGKNVTCFFYKRRKCINPVRYLIIPRISRQIIKFSPAKSEINLEIHQDYVRE